MFIGDPYSSFACSQLRQLKYSAWQMPEAHPEMEAPAQPSRGDGPTDSSRDPGGEGPVDTAAKI